MNASSQQRSGAGEQAFDHRARRLRATGLIQPGPLGGH